LKQQKIVILKRSIERFGYSFLTICPLPWWERVGERGKIKNVFKTMP